jgi:hypothetical protein
VVVLLLVGEPVAVVVAGAVAAQVPEVRDLPAVVHAVAVRVHDRRQREREREDRRRRRRLASAEERETEQDRRPMGQRHGAVECLTRETVSMRALRIERARRVRALNEIRGISCRETGLRSRRRSGPGASKPTGADRSQTIFGPQWAPIRIFRARCAVSLGA